MKVGELEILPSYFMCYPSSVLHKMLTVQTRPLCLHVHVLIRNIERFHDYSTKNIEVSYAVTVTCVKTIAELLKNVLSIIFV